MGGAWYPAKSVHTSDVEWWLHSDACETYGYTAEIGAPTTATGVFSVTYDGWTAPPKALTPKARFQFKADAVPNGNDLALRPEIHVPDCAR